MSETAWTTTPFNTAQNHATEATSNGPVNPWFSSGVRLLLLNLCSLGFFYFGFFFTRNLSVMVITFTILLCILAALRVTMDHQLTNFYTSLAPSMRTVYSFAVSSINAGLILHTIWQAYQLPNMYHLAALIFLLLSLGLEYFLPLSWQQTLHQQVTMFGIETFHEATKVKFSPVRQVLVTTAIVLAVLGLFFYVVKVFNMLITSFLSFVFA